MLTIPKSRYSELVEKLEIAGVRGIAFDIVFQNPDNEEKSFANLLGKYKNIIIGTSIYGQSGTGNCITDGSGGITCEGSPRNSYTSIPWGSIDVGRLYDTRESTIQSAQRANQ